MYKANDIDSGAPQADVALSEATTFMRSAKEILLLTTYTARTSRSLEKNMAELRRLQAERQAQLEKDQEEAQLLHQLAESKRETFDTRAKWLCFFSARTQLPRRTQSSVERGKGPLKTTQANRKKPPENP